MNERQAETVTPRGRRARWYRAPDDGNHHISQEPRRLAPTGNGIGHGVRKNLPTPTPPPDWTSGRVATDAGASVQLRPSEPTDNFFGRHNTRSGADDRLFYDTRITDTD